MAIWTQADVDALKAVVGTGILTVSYAGPPARTITYQNTQQMEQLLARMIVDVAGSATAADGSPARTTHRFAGTNKGFHS